MVAVLESGSYTELMNLPMDEFFEVRSVVLDIANERKRALNKHG